MLVLVAILAVVALYIFEFGIATSNSSTKFASVTVSGSAVTVQPGFTALNLIFRDEGGKVFNATITNGHYNIILPTNHTYSVRFNWAGGAAGIPGSAGQCAEPNLTIPASPASANVSKDWSC